MKSRQQLSARNDSETGGRRTPGPARQQISACVLPTLIAAAATWFTFASTGDWQVSLVLGGVAFLTATPLTGRLSDRGSAQGRPDR